MSSEDEDESKEQDRQETERKQKEGETMILPGRVERIYFKPLDRLMRFKDRFIVNPYKHPKLLYSEIINTVNQKC